MRLTALLFCLVLSIGSYASTLSEQIDVLIAEKDSNLDVGVLVERLDTGERIVARNAEQRYTPASITKSLTTYVAMKTLGTDFTFDTKLFEKNNNIYIHFVGDPSLTSEDLYALLDQIKIKNINNIVIDDTVFEKPYYARGWTYDSLDWYYAAPISSVILDENKFNLNISPAAELNSPAIITLADNLQNIILNSQVFTATEEQSESMCQLNISVSEANIIDLYGCWPITMKPRSLNPGIRNPNLYVQQTIERYLIENNIKIKGEILIGKKPERLQPIATHSSQPLSVLAIDILANTKNFTTEPYTKTLGQHFYKQASFQAGSFAIKEQLTKQLNLGEDEIVLYDGSGADAYNLITPNAMVKVLTAAYFDESVQPAYRNAEAKPGKRGTLKNRLKNLPEEAQFSGKTGTGNNASTIAGTMYNAENIPLVIVVMTNGNPQKYRASKQLQDEIIELVYQAPVAQLDSASPS